METAMRLLLFAVAAPLCCANLCVMASAVESSRTDPAADLLVMQNDLSAYGVSTLDCGLHALYAASILLDSEIPFDSLFGDLSIKLSSRGISDSELIRLAEKHGLVAEKTSGLSSADLSSTKCPLIIPLRLSRGSENFHWVTLCEVKSDGFIFFDSNDGHVRLTRSEVDCLWDGKAILTGPTRKIVNESQNLLWLNSFSRKILFLSIVLGFVFATNNVGILRRRKSIALAVGGVIMYVGLHASLGSSEYRSLLKLSNCWNEQLITERYVREIPSDPETLIVDCRQPADFRSGHIAGAVNLPINASAFLWNRFVTTHRKRRILVYCQSVHCGWAERFQKRCTCLGIEAAVLSGGYERFKEQS